MKREDLYDAITDVRDELVEEAGRTRPARKARPWRRWVGIAACLALIAGVGGGAVLGLLPRLGGSSGGAGGSGSDGSSVFQSYAGPVLPLTVLGEDGGLTASRHITWDFSPWAPVWVSNEDQMEEARAAGATAEELENFAEELEDLFPEGGYASISTDVRVEDQYTLTNPTDQDLTLTLLYPYVGSLDDTETPALTLNGEPLETEMYAGPYSGGFTGALGEVQEGGSLNLDRLDSWEDYEALLRDGSYQQAALGGFPDLTGVPVTVYELSEIYGPSASETAPNPTLQVSFALDYDRTTVLTYGFNGGRFDPAGGWMGVNFSIPEPGEPGYGASVYLIILGDDLTGYTLQGYADGGCDSGEELDGAGASVTRYETNLDAVLRELEKAFWRLDSSEAGSSGWEELAHGAVCQLLTTYGILGGEQAAERYSDGMLESIFGEARYLDRVLYLRADVTIPAGEQVTLLASQTKEASFDYACTDRGNRGVYGFDMVMTLGTALEFTQVTASIVHCDEVELVRQNFGFDLENGVTQVTLDPATEHYYLEVRRISAEE